MTTSGSFSTASPVCSGRGTCLPISSLQSLALTGGLSPLQPSSPLLYSNWEAGRAFACRCDRGYGGPDCSLALCPRGDYSLVTGKQRTVLVLTVDASALGGLSAAAAAALAPPPAIFLAFMGATTKLPIALPSLTSSTCAAAFFGDGRLGVDAAASACRVAAPGQPSIFPGQQVLPGTLEVALSLAWAAAAQPPPVDNMFSHTGNPPLSAFFCAADPSSPPAYLSGLTCTLAFADVLALALGGGPDPPSLPSGVSYLLTIDSEAADSAAGLSTVGILRVTAGSPPTSLVFPSQPLSAAPTLLGQPSDNLYVSFAALGGHTRGASWSIGAQAAALNSSAAAAGGPPVVLAGPAY